MSVRCEVVLGSVSQGRGGGWNCGSGPPRSQNSTVVPPKSELTEPLCLLAPAPEPTSCPLSDPSPLST